MRELVHPCLLPALHSAFVLCTLLRIAKIAVIVKLHGDEVLVFQKYLVGSAVMLGRCPPRLPLYGWKSDQSSPSCSQGRGLSDGPCGKVHAPSNTSTFTFDSSFDLRVGYASVVLGA